MFPATEEELYLHFLLDKLTRAWRKAQNSRSRSIPYNMDPNWEEYYESCKSDYLETLKEYEQKRTSK